MKLSKLFNGIAGMFNALILLVLLALGASMTLDVSITYTLPVTAAVGVGVSFIPHPQNVLRMGLFKEIWTGELIKQFREAATWMAGIPDFSGEAADNNTINLTEVGVDPAVLINNTTYPIPVVERDDQNVAILLDKFETENTKIPFTDIETLPYDKIQDVIRQHEEVIRESFEEKAAHALAPADDTNVKTPVVKTTGADDGGGDKQITINDITKLKRTFDDLRVPKINRTLVLSNAHLEQLLTTSEAFSKQYQVDSAAGKIGTMLFGWSIHEFSGQAIYDSSFVKKAFGAVKGGTDRDASFAFYQPRMFQAARSPKMFHSIADQDPQNREDIIGFSLRGIVLPKTVEAFGAIVADDV